HHRSRGMSTLPIADYGLISDCHSAALVSRMGSVDWLCFPRFDAPSIFGRLLDDDAGHWSIHPTVECTTTRRYIDQTLVLETTFTASTGKAVLLDSMAVGKNERGHQLGAAGLSVAERDRRRCTRSRRGLIPAALLACSRCARREHLPGAIPFESGPNRLICTAITFKFGAIT